MLCATSTWNSKRTDLAGEFVVSPYINLANTVVNFCFAIGWIFSSSSRRTIRWFWKTFIKECIIRCCCNDVLHLQYNTITENVYGVKIVTKYELSGTSQQKQLAMSNPLTIPTSGWIHLVTNDNELGQEGRSWGDKEMSNNNIWRLHIIRDEVPKSRCSNRKTIIILWSGYGADTS